MFTSQHAEVSKISRVWTHEEIWARRHLGWLDLKIVDSQRCRCGSDTLEGRGAPHVLVEVQNISSPERLSRCCGGGMRAWGNIGYCDVIAVTVTQEVRNQTLRNIALRVHYHESAFYLLLPGIQSLIPPSQTLFHPSLTLLFSTMRSCTLSSDSCPISAAKLGW